MMKRIIWTNLPNIEHNIYLKKQTNKYNNKKKGELPMLKPNDKVRIKLQEKCKRKGIILKKIQQSRSYLVKTEQGLIIKRNRQHLLKIQEKVINPVTNKWKLQWKLPAEIVG